MHYRSHVSRSDRLKSLLRGALGVVLLAFAVSQLAGAVANGAIHVAVRGGDFWVTSDRPVAFGFFVLLWLILGSGAAIGSYVALRNLLRR
jgi:hypothetical protein